MRRADISLHWLVDEGHGSPSGLSNVKTCWLRTFSKRSCYELSVVLHRGKCYALLLATVGMRACVCVWLCGCCNVHSWLLMFACMDVSVCMCAHAWFCMQKCPRITNGEIIYSSVHEESVLKWFMFYLFSESPALCCKKLCATARYVSRHNVHGTTTMYTDTLRT